MKLISGGADGIDAIWLSEAIKRHVEIEVYSFEGHKTKAENPLILSWSELHSADYDLMKIAKSINRTFPSANDYVNNLLRRDYLIGKRTTGIIAIGTTQDNIIVDGGTAWAIECAKLNTNAVFLYDMQNLRWKYWNWNQFSLLSNPIGPKLNNFPLFIYGCIGMSELTKNQDRIAHVIIRNILNRSGFKNGQI